LTLSPSAAAIPGLSQAFNAAVAARTAPIEIEEDIADFDPTMAPAPAEAALGGEELEPDEEELKKTKPSNRMRVFAVGPMANFIVAFVALLLLFICFYVSGSTY
jgi:membrane-associated protease RseP (regulator of RpoE activity)